MTVRSSQKDLVLLVADKNMEHALKGVLSRPQSLRIRDITHDIFVHPHRDPGVLLRGQDFMKSFVSRYSYAMVLFDRDGCGQGAKSRKELEDHVERNLAHSGWQNRSAAIVIDPELDIWVWSDSPHVETVLGWEGRPCSLRSWIADRGFLRHGQTKPDRPKEALECILREVRKPRSSSIYQTTFPKGWL